MRCSRLPVGIATILVVVSSGCASFSNPDKQSDNKYSDLYDKQAKLVHEAGRGSEGTADQAMARGDELLSQGDTDRALFEYIKAIEKDNSKVEALYKIGTIHAARGNLPLAQAAYQKVLERSVKHAGALEGLGLVYLQQRQYGKARDHLNRAVENDPQRWQAHNGLGVLADLEKQYDVAASHYQQALQIKPDQPLLLNNLGYSNYLLGQWDTAQQYLESALRIDPQYKRGWENLGLVYARRGDYNRAKAALLHTMGEPQALNDLGYLAMLQGKHDRAEDFLKQAIALSPTYYAVAHENLKRCTALQGERTLTQ
jgi:Flp pilus assembly protein TadD